MEKAKIRPLAIPKLLNRSSQKLASVITSWTAPGMQNFVAIGSGVSVPPNTWFCRAFGVIMLVFLGSSVRLQPTPLDGYLRKIRQMTSFRVRKCLLGSRWLYFIFGPLHFGDRFWLVFFATENRFNMGMFQYKLPLIVIVAP